MVEERIGGHGHQRYCCLGHGDHLRPRPPCSAARVSFFRAPLADVGMLDGVLSSKRPRATLECSPASRPSTRPHPRLESWSRACSPAVIRPGHQLHPLRRLHRELQCVHAMGEVGAQSHGRQDNVKKNSARVLSRKKRIFKGGVFFFFSGLFFSFLHVKVLYNFCLEDNSLYI